MLAVIDERYQRLAGALGARLCALKVPWGRAAKTKPVSALRRVGCLYVVLFFARRHETRATVMSTNYSFKK